MAGAISLPSDEEQGGFKKTLNQARNWVNKKINRGDESTPLLGGEPRKTKSRILITLLSLVIAVAVLAVSLFFWLNHRDTITRAPLELTDAEKFFIDFPSNDSIRGYLKTYTSEAHLAGTANDKKQAEWTRDQFESFGLKAEIKTYWPLLNYPVSHRFGIVSGPKHLRYEAKLTENPVDEDETSKDPNVIPTFHGYSKNGTVTGRVIYANYGRVEDFQYLKDQGIEIEGTIALVRYGGNFRGLKVRVAELFGCAGVLIYSDPIDDGPLDKDETNNPAKSYPDGPWRSESSAQRGSVQYLSLVAGDPLTIGYPATENATRIKPEDSPGLAKIPSLPLSWEDALPILKATQGLGVRGDKEWNGGLEGVDYYSGPTEGEAILTNHVDNKITPIWNVIARIEGTEEPNKVIVLGNHRDAWVYGAVDPSSGSAAMLEVARTFGELLKSGWRPRRTIVLASWDAEEYGLVGSTEWVEDNKEWLSKEAAVYINVDIAVAGPIFDAAASPSLNHLIYSITRKIQDPNSGNSLFDKWKSDRKVGQNENPPIGALGSGSDFVAFLDHVGIASVNLGFGGDYGVYHSNYDSFHWMEKFGDPQFLYHQTLVRIWGILAVRLADSPILPLYPSDYSAELLKYTESLSDEFAPTKFKALEHAAKKLEKTASKFERHRQHLEAKLAELKDLSSIPEDLAKHLQKVNNRLTYFERGLLCEEGIKGREWFKHVVYAPGLWTGYSSQVFPAIVEGIENNDIDLTRHAEANAADALHQAAKNLKADYD